MKTPIFLSVALLVVLPGVAMADCNNPQVTGASLTTLLTDNTVCVGSAPTWNNQEYHETGGSLIDYKRGPGHATDPTETVGSWAITDTDTRVTYTYSGTSYSFSVHENINGTHSFCDAGSSQAAVGTVKAGGGPNEGGCDSLPGLAALPAAPASTPRTKESTRTGRGR